MKYALIFLAAAIGTYLIRISGIVFLGGRQLPARVMRSLRLIAPAAMAAIIANSLLLDAGQWRTPGAWHIAGSVSIGVAVWRRSTGLSMVVGAVVFAALLALGW